MNNLTSELVEEFREKFVDEKRGRVFREKILCSSEGDELETFMLTAFDRVRAEGKKEAAMYIHQSALERREWSAGYEMSIGEILKEAASGESS